MLEAGIKGQHTILVEKENTAAVMKSGTLAVFATPAMIALIEETAWKSVADELEEGCVTVGTSLNVTSCRITGRNEGNLQYHSGGSGWKTPCIFRRSRG